MAAHKIRQQGDKYYSLFFLERGKGVSDGIMAAGDFEDLKLGEGKLVYTRNGGGARSAEFKKGDYDLMIESIGEIDLSSFRKNFDTGSFSVYQVGSVAFRHRFDDPGLISSTDYLTVAISNRWPECRIRTTQEMQSLIAGIRREISLGKLGI